MRLLGRRGTSIAREVKEAGRSSVDLSEKDRAQLFEQAVNQCTLRMMTHRLYMHYGVVPGEKDQSPLSPTWEHQHIYFWDAEEPFERKSLPEHFRDAECHYFVFMALPNDLRVAGGVAMPWFGQPGGAMKYHVVHGLTKIPLNELKRLGIVREVEPVTVTFDNVAVLTDRIHYFLMVNEKDLHPEQLRVMDSTGKLLTLYEALQLGKVRVVRLADTR